MQPDPSMGECVDATIEDEHQSWALTTCELLLLFLCRAQACPTGSFHCSNGRCVNSASRCDQQDDCGDWSDELDCPNECHYYMASSGDVVESPSYPHKYPPLANCEWTLEGPQGHNILLQFQDFETEKTFDTVQVLVGGRTEDKSVNLATLSGKLDLSSQLYVSASNFMIIKFSSDASEERTGFRATPQGQALTSPGFPNNYPGGLECLYILTAQIGRIMTLEIDSLDIEPTRDIILIRDGDSPKSQPIARLTGLAEDNPKLIMSTGDKMYLYFKTGLGDSRKGFKIKYSQGCQPTIVAKNGTIASPAFGLKDYSSNQDCLYRIRNPGGGRLSLALDHFQVHQSDMVQVYDGASTSGLRLHPGNGFSADSVPRITLTASSGGMLVRFQTDALHNSKGWKATFSADCSVLQPGEGALASSRDTAFGTIVTFSCPMGQEFATGKQQITTECLKGGNCRAVSNVNVYLVGRARSQNCEINIDDCAEKPCLLGANCTDLVNDFKCTCPSGFTGKRCHEKIDLCANGPCENGVCVDKLFVHQCVCKPGWTGRSCEININDCSVDPCENGGVCVDIVDGYMCNCEPGYTGKRCQHLIDDCASEPCQNGATCLDMLDGFVCHCLQCEAEIDECLGDPCNPEGTKACIDEDNRFTCQCRDGFTGELCETNVDDCSAMPCLNGGSCRDEIGHFRCECPPGWTESDIGTCTNQPCQNSAKCINLFQDFFCV
ncbi:hypothetical protein FOCC_FOCC016509 [Frankliniella occidentalis]|nr:hypothetical protein FOCC_FOCC016509 [Frankliniella occidentalis]